MVSLHAFVVIYLIAVSSKMVFLTCLGVGSLLDRVQRSLGHRSLIIQQLAWASSHDSEGKVEGLHVQVPM